MTSGTLAQVSTLLMLVGFPQSPLSAGYGGRGRGMPRLPSIEAISAVSSPQTKAPAPRLICTSKSKPVPRMSAPSRPRSLACSMAMPSVLDRQRVLRAHVDVALLAAPIAQAPISMPSITLCGFPSSTLRSM